MDELQESHWFNEKWATEVRDTTRKLVRLYLDALDQVEALPRFFQAIRLSGIRGGMRPYFIIKPLLRDAVVEHIRRVLQATTPLHLRALAAARPSPREVSLGVKKTAPAETLAKATAEREAFLAKQVKIAALLEEASKDIREFLAVLGTEEGAGQRGFKLLARAARQLLPFLWAGVVIAKFGEWSNDSPLQAAAFILGALILYHLLAWITLPFHDAAERKHVYFEGYIGGASDGLKPLFPPPSRYEETLFKLFGKKPPVVLSWETLVPVLHYALISVLLIIMWVKLPFGANAKSVVGMFVAILIWGYVRQIYLLWLLLGIRYKGRSAWEIVAALFASVRSLAPLQEQSEAGGKGDADD